MDQIIGQLRKAFSFSNNSSEENDKTDFETNQPENVQQGVEALEHDFLPGTSDIRLLVFLRRVEDTEKIIFDSDYVTDEGHYTATRQSDARFLKKTVAEFTFGGNTPLKRPETLRFTKLDDTRYAFAVVFQLATTSASTNPSPRRPPPCPSRFQDSTSSSASDSGYSSLPALDDCGGSGSDCSSSSPSQLSPSHSLPATPHHLSQHRSLYPASRRSRSSYNSSRSRLTLGAVLLFSRKISPSLIEPTLLPMQTFISQMYLGSRAKFPKMLKTYYNSLTSDVYCSVQLSKCEIANDVDIDFKALFSMKIFSDFIFLLVTNPNAKVAVISPKKGTSNNSNAIAIFKLCYLLKQFRSKFPLSWEQRNNSLHPVNKFSDPIINSPSSNLQVDSGFFSCTTFKSKSSICDENVEEEMEQEEKSVCDTNLEEKDEESRNNKSKNKFYLGDEEDDEQTEAKLGLSEPMKEKLYPKGLSETKAVITVRNIPLNLEELSTSTKTWEQITYTYHLNQSCRFSPFANYQLFHSPPDYDYIHTITNEILEINLDKSLIRGFNLNEGDENDSNSLNYSNSSQRRKDSIKDLLAKTRELTKIVTDTEKIILFFLVHLVEIMK